MNINQLVLVLRVSYLRAERRGASVDHLQAAPTANMYVSHFSKVVSEDKLKKLTINVIRLCLNTSDILDAKPPSQNYRDKQHDLEEDIVSIVSKLPSN